MFIATTVVVATLLTPTTQPQPSGPACQTAPDGSSQEIIDCYDEACKVYRAAFNACSSIPCTAAAIAQYSLDLDECWGVEVQIHQITYDPWISIWYDGDQFGVSFNKDILVGSHAFLF